jgi:hypothetical protein
MTHHPNDPNDQWYWLTKRSDVEITWSPANYVVDKLNFDGLELNPIYKMNSMYKLCPNGMKLGWILKSDPTRSNLS